jgi:hypothetical protein
VTAAGVQVWTCREVHYDLASNGPADEPERLGDALMEHYHKWPYCALFTPVVSGSIRVVTVGGLPWWLPAWWHRRAVAKTAANAGIGGTAESHTVRCVLPAKVVPS